MAQQKPCIRCERPIDSYARSCVYCGWDQATPRPVETAGDQVVPAYIPPPDNRLRNRLLGTVGFVALVIIAFFIVSRVHSSAASDARPQTTPRTASAATANSQHRATATLVPVDGGGSTPYESPVTSAPAQPLSPGNVEVNGDRTDATALPSEAYSAAAQRARAERDVRPNHGGIDPRTIVGGPESYPVRSTPRATTHPAPDTALSVPRTEPVLLYQPVPSMRVDQSASARLILTVSAEGRVNDINIAQSIPGEMPRLVAAVQNWRFKPATENGHPVKATFSVDITVHPQ